MPESMPRHENLNGSPEAIALETKDYPPFGLCDRKNRDPAPPAGEPDAAKKPERSESADNAGPQRLRHRLCAVDGIQLACRPIEIMVDRVL